MAQQLVIKIDIVAPRFHLKATQWNGHNLLIKMGSSSPCSTIDLSKSLPFLGNISQSGSMFAMLLRFLGFAHSGLLYVFCRVFTISGFGLCVLDFCWVNSAAESIAMDDI